MKVLIAGADGFLGTSLAAELRPAGHEVWRLGRRPTAAPNELVWDGETSGAWTRQIEGMDAIVNVTGYSLANWPWTAARKRRFLDSRVKPAAALSAAIRQAKHPPRVFLQTSGINFYGLRGKDAAEESSAPGEDFLAHLCVEWESASAGVEAAGVRRIITRNAVVLDARNGLLPLMALPVRLFLGGRLGAGSQAMCWVHIADYLGAVKFLLENSQASGPYNVVAPTSTSSEQFVKSLAAVLHRPYWLPAPGFLLRLGLGEMSVLIAEGRYSRPAGLERLGYRFRFPTVDSALNDLFVGR